jgi:phosphatidylethanolamine-binding protein
MIGSSVSRTAAITIACTLGVGVVIAQTPQAPAAPPQGRGGGTPPLLMTTTAFEDGGVIPDKYTQAAGPNAISPELKWSQVPAGTQSFALLAERIARTAQSRPT